MAFNCNLEFSNHHSEEVDKWSAAIPRTDITANALVLIMLFRTNLITMMKTVSKRIKFPGRWEDVFTPWAI
jgi:hypothetical protein